LDAVSLVVENREFLSPEQGFFNWNREFVFRPFRWFEPLQKLIAKPIVDGTSAQGDPS